MNIQTIKFKVTGLGPMLMNNPSGIVRNKPTTNTNKQHTAEDEIAKALYRDKEGYYLPSVGFRLGMLYAAGGLKVGKRTARSVLQSSVFCETNPRCTILDAKTMKPKKEGDFEIDERSVVINKARVLKARPKFTNWACVLELSADLDAITPEVVLESLKRAGILSGIGDFRISTKGEFGRYEAQLL
jgi:hypothetical protein